MEAVLPKKTIRLNGVCKDIETLLGIKVNFIALPFQKNLALCPCPLKKFCVNHKDFLNQRKLCRNAEVLKINQAKDKKPFEIFRFKCGLSELIFPVFNGRKLFGAILTNKLSFFNSRQVKSLASLLNYYRPLLREAVASQKDLEFKTKDKIIIGKAKDFIRKNYHHAKIPLRDLAREVNSSYFCLCRLFKKELGLNFVQYLTLIRLKASLSLLLNPNLTVYQVAYAVGFPDAQYFDRIFKKFFHCRPNQYRHLLISKREELKQKVLSPLY